MRRGSQFVSVPERGLLVREDLDTKCHYELDEMLNVWLTLNSTPDKGDLTRLYMVAVNPDGDRRVSRDKLVFWHPKALALELKQQFHSFCSMDADRKEPALLKLVTGWYRDFRGRAYSTQQLQANHQEEQQQKEKDEQHRQLEWQLELMEKDC